MRPEVEKESTNIHIGVMEEAHITQATKIKRAFGWKPCADHPFLIGSFNRLGS
jgi:hypothetical protein